MNNKIDVLSFSLFSPLEEVVKEKTSFVLKKTVLKGHVGIILLTNIGEKACFLPVLESIKIQFPKVILHIFTDEHGYELFDKNPYLDYLHIVPVREWKRSFPENLPSLIKTWLLKNRENLKCVFNFSPSLFSAALASGLSRSRKHTFGLFLDEDMEPVVEGNKWMQYFCYVMYPELWENPVCNFNTLSHRSLYSLALGISPSPKEGRSLFAIKEEIDLPEDRAYIGICPSAEYQSRQWPVEKFKELAVRVHDRMGYDIILMDEKSGGYEFFSDYPFVHDCCGSGLGRLITCMSRCRAIVSNHNSLIQIAGAISVPVLSIGGGHCKGPEFPGQHLAIRKIVPCSPCYVSSCHRLYCLQNLDAEEVFNIFKWQLSMIQAGSQILSYEVPLELTNNGSIEITADCPYLPDELYKQVVIQKKDTLCVVKKIVDISYALLWDRANNMFLNQPLLMDRKKMLDWIFAMEINWQEFFDKLEEEINFIREWEDRLSILLLRLQEFLPRPWQVFKQKIEIDPENLMDSLITFDKSFPKIFMLLSRDAFDYGEETDNVLQRIRNWMRSRKFLLQLTLEYRSMLEDFMLRERKGLLEKGR